MREGLITTVLIIGWFAVMMTFGFQLRFGAWPWEMPL